MTKSPYKTTNDIAKTAHQQPLSIPGLLYGDQALMAAGMQPEFAEQNKLVVEGVDSPLILRADSAPIYYRQRAAKTIFNLSKTSNHGFLKGVIAEQAIFTRINSDAHGIRQTMGHHPKDHARLKLAINQRNHQHCSQLTISLPELLREIAPSGDLKVLAYYPDSTQLHLQYKADKGPSAFNGAFILQLNQGISEPHYEATPWLDFNTAEQWSKNESLLKKPASLSRVEDNIYFDFSEQSCPLWYVDNLSDDSLAEDKLKPVNVFVNTPRRFKAFMRLAKPHRFIYDKIKHLETLHDILAHIDKPSLKRFYNTVGIIITGDWDGLLLAPPQSTPKQYQQEFNTYSIINMRIEMQTLLRRCEEKLVDVKQAIEKKADEEKTDFDALVSSIEYFRHIISPEALSGAGSITPHEFFTQQLINHRFKQHKLYCSQQETSVITLQLCMDWALSKAQQDQQTHKHSSSRQSIIEQTKEYYRKHLACDDTGLKELPAWTKKRLENHLMMQLHIALEKKVPSYTIPELTRCEQLVDLYQHGFDMRNPEGSHLEGAWLCIMPNGDSIYGQNQQQLVDFILQQHLIDNYQLQLCPKVDMNLWAKVVEAKLKAGQSVTDDIKLSYQQHINQKNKEHGMPLAVSIKSIASSQTTTEPKTVQQTLCGNYSNSTKQKER